MKKGFKILLLFSLIFSFGFKSTSLPNNYYKVYLNDELLGTITSKSKLED